MTISFQFRPNPPISELSIECSNKNLSSVLILNQCNFLKFSSKSYHFLKLMHFSNKKYFQLLLFCYAKAENHAESIFLIFPLSKTHSCVPYNQSIWFIDSHDEQKMSQLQTSFLSRNEHMKYSLYYIDYIVYKTSSLWPIWSYLGLVTVSSTGNPRKPGSLGQPSIGERSTGLTGALIAILTLWNINLWSGLLRTSTKTRTSASTLGTVKRVSKIQDGEDVDVLRSPIWWFRNCESEYLIRKV